MITLLLADLVSADRVRIPLAARDKAGVISELSEVAARAAGLPEESGTIREAVEAREEVLSTGIGGGVALPHGKTGRLEELVVVAGTSPEPIDFRALDGKPVRLFVMLVGPPGAAGVHVKALSRISRLLRERTLRERLLAAADPEEFVSILKAAESA